MCVTTEIHDAAREAYWSMDRSVRVHLIENKDDFEKHRGDILAAVICSLDAEWQPFTSRPVATLLQLGCICSMGTKQVFLLDLQELDPKVVRPLLQSVFRNDEVVKVGFGMEADLRALAAAIGNEGGGCIAAVRSHVDVAGLHRHLSRAGCPVPATSGSSLSSLVTSVLGTPLDKSQQCSAWHRRPLIDEQLVYAATDAAVLLALLEAVAALVPPSSCPICPHSPAPMPDASSVAHMVPGRATEGEHGIGVCESTRAKVPGLKTCPEVVNQSGSCGGARGHSWRQFWGFGKPPSQRGTLAMRSTVTVAAHPLAAEERSLTPTEQFATEVAAAWSCSISFERGAFYRSGRGVHARVGEVGRRHRASNTSYIPWIHGSATEKKFVCDVMLEGLARQMRLFGMDCLSMPERNKHERAASIREMLQLGRAQQRVVLTGDRVAATTRDSEHCYLVRSQRKQDQLAEVVKEFAIELRRDEIMTRCTACGGALMSQVFSYESLPSGCTVPDGTRLVHDRFWACSICKKTFWQGSQYENSLTNLTKRLHALQTR